MLRIAKGYFFQLWCLLMAGMLPLTLPIILPVMMLIDYKDLKQFIADKKHVDNRL